MAKKKPYQRAERQRQLAREAELAAHRRQRITVRIAAAVSLLIVAGAVVALILTGGGDDTATPPGPAAETPAAIPAAIAKAPVRPTPFPATVSCSYPASTDQVARKVKAPATGKVPARGAVAVTLDTTAGKLNLTLNRALAPCAVHSFLNLVKQQYYDSTSCHRLTVGEGLQVLQCGDPSGMGGGGPGYRFADEVFPSLKYGRGMLAMANSGPDSNGSQFFVVYGDASALEPDYTVFGSVDAAGLQVVDAVARAGAIPEQAGTGDGRPVTPVVIKTATAAAD